MSNQSYDFNLSVGIKELLDADSAAKVESQIKQQKERIEEPVEIKVALDVGDARQQIKELQKEMTIAANNIKKLKNKKSGLSKEDYNAIARHNSVLDDNQRKINAIIDQLKAQGSTVRSTTKEYKELQAVLEDIGYVEKKKKTTTPRKQATSEVKQQIEAEKEHAQVAADVVQQTKNTEKAMKDAASQTKQQVDANKQYVRSLQDVQAELESERKKLKEIEGQQRRNDAAHERFPQKQQNYGGVELGSNKPVYDIDKIRMAESALKNFNTQLEKRNQFVEKYAELTRLIAHSFVGQYGIENGLYGSIDEFIEGDSQLKQLQSLATHGIKGVPTKDINELFSGVVRRLKSSLMDVRSIISSGGALSVDVIKRLDEEELAIGQERQRLYEAREAQLSRINALHEEEIALIIQKGKEEAKQANTAAAVAAAYRDKAHEQATSQDDIDTIQKENGALEEKLELLQEIAAQYANTVTAGHRSRYEELNQKESESGLTDRESDRYYELGEAISEADEQLEEFGKTYERIILKLENGRKITILPDDAGLRKFNKLANESYGSDYDGIDIADVSFVRIKQQTDAIKENTQAMEQNIESKKLAGTSQTNDSLVKKAEDVKAIEATYESVRQTVYALREQLIAAMNEQERLQAHAEVYGYTLDMDAKKAGRIQDILSKTGEEFTRARAQAIPSLLSQGYTVQKNRTDYGISAPLATGYTPITKTEYEYALYLQEKIKELNVGWDEGLRTLGLQNSQLVAANAYVDSLKQGLDLAVKAQENAYERMAYAHAGIFGDDAIQQHKSSMLLGDLDHQKNALWDLQDSLAKDYAAVDQELASIEGRYFNILDLVRQWQRLGSQIKTISGGSARDVRKQLIDMMKSLSPELSYIIGEDFSSAMAKGFKGIKTNELIAMVSRINNTNMMGGVDDALEALSSVDLRSMDESALQELRSEGLSLITPLKSAMLLLEQVCDLREKQLEITKQQTAAQWQLWDVMSRETEYHNSLSSASGLVGARKPALPPAADVGADQQFEFVELESGQMAMFEGMSEAVDAAKELDNVLQDVAKIPGQISFDDILQTEQTAVDTAQEANKAREQGLEIIKKQNEAKEEGLELDKQTAQTSKQQVDAYDEISAAELIENDINKAIAKLRTAQDNETTLFNLKGVFSGDDLVSEARSFVENIADESDLKVGKFSAKNDLIQVQLYNDALKVTVDQTYRLRQASEDTDASLELIGQSFKQNVKALNENNFDVDGIRARATASVDKVKSSLHGLEYDMSDLEEAAKNITSQDDFTKFNNQLKAAQDQIQAIKNSTVSKNSMNPLANMQRDMQTANIELDTMRLKLQKIGDIEGVEKAEQIIEDMTVAVQNFNDAQTAESQQSAYNQYSNLRSQFKAQMEYLNVKKSVDPIGSDESLDGAKNIKKYYNDILNVVNKINSIDLKINDLAFKDKGTGLYAGVMQNLETQKAFLVNDLNSLQDELSQILSIKPTDGQDALSFLFEDARVQAALTIEEVQNIQKAFMQIENMRFNFGAKLSEQVQPVIEKIAHLMQLVQSGAITNPDVVGNVSDIKDAIGQKSQIFNATNSPVAAMDFMKYVDGVSEYIAQLDKAAEKERKYFASKKSHEYSAPGSDLGTGAKDADKARQTLEDYVRSFKDGKAVITGFTTSMDGISKIDFSWLDESTGQFHTFYTELGRFSDVPHTFETSMKNLSAGTDAANKSLATLSQTLESLNGVTGAENIRNGLLQKMKELEGAKAELGGSKDVGDQTRLKNMAADYEKAAKAAAKLAEAIAEGKAANLGDIDKSGNIYAQMLERAQVAAEGATISNVKFDDTTNTLRYTMTDASGAVKEMVAQMSELGTVTARVDKIGQRKTWWQELGSGIGGLGKQIGNYVVNLFQVMDIVRYLRTGFNEVLEIDTALTELRKVTDETSATYSNFLQTMSKTGAVIGSTVKDLTTSAADWARLGSVVKPAPLHSNM